MTIVGAGAASGGAQLLPEVLDFSTSLPFDRQLLREDLLGSLAHVTMLGRTGIIPRDAATQIRGALATLWGATELPHEEDVHMAVETLLAQKLGDVAGMLHTARSRNDQVALDLHLHVREQVALAAHELAELLQQLAERARAEKDTLLPAYTHRQRAQAVSAAYYLCGYGAMFARDVDALQFVLEQVDQLPLGVGAIGGTSMPIDREVTRALLKFSRISVNGLDTVGNRDFALDFAYATARSLAHASRVATDMIDFSTAEFATVKLDDQIAMGSSMMPQKRNPDLFELIRGKTGRAAGNLTALYVTLKGLPGGYNRDLQEDRQALLETGPLLRSVLQMLRTGLAHVKFDKARGLAALEDGATAATDVAEALAQTGVPFRTAYKLTGALVRRCLDAGIHLSQAPLALAQQVDSRFTQDILRAADARASVAHKRNAGGPGAESIDAQIEWLSQKAREARALAARVPRLDQLFAEVREAQL